MHHPVPTGNLIEAQTLYVRLIVQQFNLKKIKKTHAELRNQSSQI